MVAHASIIGDFCIGYQRGKTDAHTDWYHHFHYITADNGKLYTVYGKLCPRQNVINSFSYCTGYDIGYDYEIGTFSQTPTGVYDPKNETQ